jgi:hypothetical protein
MKIAIVLMAVVAFTTIAWPAISAEPEVTSEASMQKMHSHMQMMQGQIDQMHASDDPEERERMMREHSQAILDGNVMMAEMEAADMHKMMNMKDMKMQGKGSESMADDMPCQRMVAMQDSHHDKQEHRQMMQKRMQKMMEHMTEHQSMQAEPGE